MSDSRYDWVEIIEPRSGDHMFANLKSGQCLWEPPEGANVKATSDNQWWELYDSNTRRYYYYNSATQKTVWRKPQDADIIALAKLQLLKAKEAKYVDKSITKPKAKPRPRDGSVSSKPPSPTDIKISGFSQPEYETSIINSKLTEQKTINVDEEGPDYVNVNYDNDIKFDISVTKSNTTDVNDDKDELPLTKAYSLENITDADDIKGRKMKWMSVRDPKSIDKDRSANPPEFNIESVPTPDSPTAEYMNTSGTKRAPPKPPRESVSPSVSPRKFSMDSQLRNINVNGTTNKQSDVKEEETNGANEVHIYDEFDDQNSSGDSAVDKGGYSAEKCKTIERPARPPPPAPSGSMTLPNPKRNKLPEPYSSGHTPMSFDSGSLSRNIKLALEEKGGDSYRILSTDDEENNGGNLSPLSQLMADVHEYNLSDTSPTIENQNDLVNRYEKSNAEPTTPIGLSADDGRMHYVSMYDNVEEEEDEAKTPKDVVEGSSFSKGPPPVPPPPPPHNTAVYETIPTEGSQLERKPSLSKSMSISINADQIREAVPLSTHRKGLFRRRMSIASMLSWSKSPIRKPMVLTRDKQLRKDAVDVFKLILQYMGDKTTRKNTQNIGLDIVCRGWSTPGLRDEIYVQLCKQTTENDKETSLRRGWELMCMCLAMFPTTTKFHSYLEGYIYRHLDPDNNETKVPIEAYAKHCYKQLERICGTGAKRGNKKPTLEELEQAKNMVFNPSMFGNTLEDIIEMQSERYPERRLPWIITTLADTVYKSNALTTEGIFRVPGDIDEVNMLKVHVDKWKEVTRIYEPHIPASLLKLWFRDLHEPLIPQAFYDGCIHNCEDPTVTLGIVYSLPELNHWVFGFLVRFLQSFMVPEVSKVTLMDVNNLAMVWAPNCLRCPSDDPMEILESTRKEMAFLRTIMKNWDTSFLEGVL